MHKPFYQDGLRFECTRCDACCRHEPGYVFLSETDLLRLAEAKGLSRDSLIEKYCRTVQIGALRMLSLNEKPNFDCIFWDNGCTVYDGRPLQCRSYPFWGSNVATEEAWQATAAVCPGANRGKLHRKKEIDRWLNARHRDPPITM
jgi:hypothetical protein